VKTKYPGSAYSTVQLYRADRQCDLTKKKINIPQFNVTQTE